MHESVKARRPLWVCELRTARWGYLGQEEDCPAARELLHSRQRRLQSLHLQHQDGVMDCMQVLLAPEAKY